MDLRLVAASVVIFLTGCAHSFLGERYILIRLFRRDQPKLFGSDWFTKRTLRFTWHLTTLAWWALGWFLLQLAGPGDLARDEALVAIAALSLASAAVAAAFTRGRHLSWIAFLAVAVLSWLAIG